MAAITAPVVSALQRSSVRAATAPSASVTRFSPARAQWRRALRVCARLVIAAAPPALTLRTFPASASDARGARDPRRCARADTPASASFVVATDTDVVAPS
ncbi:MAG: hypothetical protein WDW38_000267 [Sanguina aurantia]